LNLVFFSILLIGAIAYIFSKQKETRLLRFAFSIILFAQVIYFVSSLISPIVFWKYLQAQKYWWVAWLVSRLLNLIWIYLSYFVLKNTDKTKLPEITYQQPNGQTLPVWETASNWQRFFHLIIDLIICISVLSGFIRILGNKPLEFLESTLGERGLILVFIFIFRLIYYPLFEAILGATPAKFLTETRVTDEKGNKLEGNIKWENELPQRIETVRSGDYPYLYLTGSNYNRNEKYKFRMVLSDTL